jgi:uncharacterized protein
MQTNMVGWFEIPVTDMNRAVRFYEQVFAVHLARRPLRGLDMAWFPGKLGAGGSNGSLIHHPRSYSPSSNDGVLIYFNSQAGDLEQELSRVEAAGGKILQGKTLISKEIGYMALFLDTEGNRLALFSRA